MPKEAKPKIIHQGRISVMGIDGEPAELNPDEQRTVDSLQRDVVRSDAAKLTARLTHKGRPLPEQVQRAIDEMDRKARSS